MLLTGRISAAGELRYSPAGVPVLEFRVNHASRQQEAGIVRRAECEVNAVALGDTARALAKVEPERVLRFSGFLNRKGLRSTQLVLHITGYEHLKE